MNLFKKKKPQPLPYDPATQEAVVRASICTGEMVVGFIDRATGKFHEYELVRSRDEVDAFCRRAGVDPKTIRQIY